MMLTVESVAQGRCSVQKTAAFHPGRFDGRDGEGFLCKYQGMVGDTGIEPVASSV